MRRFFITSLSSATFIGRAFQIARTSDNGTGRNCATAFQVNRTSRRCVSRSPIVGKTSDPRVLDGMVFKREWIHSVHHKINGQTPRAFERSDGFMRGSCPPHLVEIPLEYVLNSDHWQL